MAVQGAAGPIVQGIVTSIFGTALYNLFGGGKRPERQGSTEQGGDLFGQVRRDPQPGLPPRPGASAGAGTRPPGGEPFPQLPPPAKRTDPNYRPDLTERPKFGRPPPKKPPPPKVKVPDSFGKPSAFRGNIAWVVGILAAQYGIDAVIRWIRSEKLDQDTDAAYARAVEQWRAARAEMRGREVLGKQAAAIERGVKAEEERRRAEIAAAEARGRAAERARVIAETPLEEIKVVAKRIPTPAPPPPPPKTYLGLTLAQWGQLGGLAYPLLAGDKKTAPTATALTTVQAAAPQLAPQSFAYFSGMQPPPTSRTRTKECDCPPKKKRQPRKPRTVCYTGTFTERASGLKKLKRRKVPCR